MGGCASNAALTGTTGDIISDSTGSIELKSVEGSEVRSAEGSAVRSAVGSEARTKSNSEVRHVSGVKISITKKSLSPVQLVPFDVFKRLGQMPRCPDKKWMLVNYEDTVRDESLYIFMSHCWLRGWSDAPDYDGRPHPDTIKHDKYKLMVAAVQSIMKLTTMTKCYIWLDFGCIDQDAAECAELKVLDKIMGICDIVLTNVYDAQEWVMPNPISNIFEEYKSPAWNGNDHAYLSRGWCRVEMLYAANIPLENNSSARIEKFKEGLYTSIQGGLRPHLLYGTREHKLVGRNPIHLPPIQNYWFDDFSPVKGKLTKESDRVHIQRLVDEITPRMKRISIGYEGQSDAVGQSHVTGVNRYANGDVYEGQFMNNQKNGRGLYRYANGDVYEGEYKDDVKNGCGVFRDADGSVYEGEFKDDTKNGRGVYRHASGNVYEGEFRNGQKNGLGVYRYADGGVYEGGLKNDKKHGKGVYRWADGSMYDGEFSEGNKHGQGTFHSPNGTIYEGEWLRGQLHGKGVARYDDGSVYEGQWQGGKYNGYGVLTGGDGVVIFSGEWTDGEPYVPIIDTVYE